MKKLLLFISFVFINVLLFADKYVIKDAEFDITGAGFKFLGKTKEYSILRNFPLNKKKVFQSNEEFETYLANYKQQLSDSRAFETIEIGYDTVLSNDSDDSENIYKVILKIKIQDSHHLLILPYPKYNSNDGFTFKIKTKDTNFLGTLNTLNFDLNTNYDDGNFTAGFNFNFDQPFNIGPLQATFVNDYSVDFLIGKSFPEFSAKTGLDLVLPFDKFSLAWGFYQFAYKDYDYEVFDDDLYFKEEFSFSVPIKLSTFENFSVLTYTPSITLSYNWDFDKIDINNNDLSSPLISLGQSLSNSKINWNNNFRKGYSFNLSNTYNYNFQRKDFYVKVSTEAQYFNNFKLYERPYFDRFGFYSRFYAFTYFEPSSNNFSYGENLSNYLRGILDGDIPDTSTAIVINVDLPHHIFSTNFKHDILNFDLQVSAFFDGALVYNKLKDRYFNIFDGAYCAGVEFLVFPKKWSSYTIRASVGFDLKAALDDTRIIKGLYHNKEISIGVGIEY